VLEDADSAAELRLRAAQLPPHQLEAAHQGSPSKFSSIRATDTSRINGVRQVAVTCLSEEGFTPPTYHAVEAERLNVSKSQDETVEEIGGRLRV
jgi:hypothetical protein